jgi:hypothetical protein
VDNPRRIPYNEFSEQFTGDMRDIDGPLPSERASKAILARKRGILARLFLFLGIGVI